MDVLDEGVGGLEALTALPRALLGSGPLVLVAPLSLR
jgi:hypothetical protein